MLTKKIMVIGVIAWLILLFVVRLLGIQSTPPAISHDEIYYASEAKALAVSLSDTSGTWRPWYLTAANPLYAELPGLLMSPAALLFPQNPILAARLTHIFAGTLLVLVLAGLAYALTEKKSVFFATLFIASWNPWIFQFSRMGFDALFSLLFYCTAIWLIIVQQNYKKLWSIPFWFIGFFCYQGLKVIFVPLVVLTVGYVYIREKKMQLSLYIILFFSLTLFAIYALLLSNQEAGGRIADLIFFDTNYTTAEVLKRRQQSLQHPLLRYFINEPTIITERFLRNYAESFSPIPLFLQGEPLRNPFSVWTHGIFYFLDVILIAVGLFALYARKTTKAAFWFLVLAAAIAPLPSAINATGVWIMFRSSFLFMVALIVGGVGLAHLYEKLHKLLFLTFFAVYLVLIARFMVQYFITYPFIGTSGQYFAERVLADYTRRNPEANITIFVPEAKFVFEAILVFRNLIVKTNIADINSAFLTKNYVIGNVRVTSECLSTSNDPNDVYIAFATVGFCEDQQNAESLLIDRNTRYTQIPSLLDSGGIFKIYNDTLCSGHDLGRFSSIQKNVFAVEQLSDAAFCQNFVIYN